MIDRLCDELGAWVSEHLGESEVAVVDRPLTDADGPAVVTWLFALRPSPTVREQEQTSYGARCRFLVTAVDESARRCQQLVGRLLTAAFRHPTFEVETDEPPAFLWRAAGIPPRPAFVLRGEAVDRVASEDVPRVRAPVTVQHAALQAMTGRVLGPAERPIAGAEVRVVETGLRTHTDREGRFRLRSVPGGPARKLEVRAGAERYAVTTTPAEGDEPLVIRLVDKES